MPDLSDSRIETIRNYFRKVDAKDATLLDLFTEDAEFFFPKFGTARGKDALARFAQRIAVDAATLTHDIDGFIFTADGNRIAVEGQEWGVTADGRSWPDGEISQGRFCNVFEFDGDLIKRAYIYVDPDVASEDHRHVALYRDKVLTASPREVAVRYFECVGAFWAAPDDPQTLTAILELFAADVDWDIAGDLQSVSWIGTRQGHEGVASFYRDMVIHIEPVRFEVQRILTDSDTAVALGDLVSRVRTTGQLIETSFAFTLRIRQGKITRYRMLEDSYAVAKAAKAQ